MVVWWRMLTLACVLLPRCTIGAAPELVAGCVVHRLGQPNKESYTPTVPLLDVLPIALKLPQGWEEFTLGLEYPGSHDRYIKIESIKETTVVSVRMLDEASGTVIVDSKDLPSTLSKYFHGGDGWIFLTFSVDEGRPTLVVEDMGTVTFQTINVGRVLGVYTQVPQIPEELSLEVGFYCQKGPEVNETTEATASSSTAPCDTSGYLIAFISICVVAGVLSLAVVSLVVYVLYLRRHRDKKQRENRKSEAIDDAEISPLMGVKVEKSGSMVKDKGSKAGQQGSLVKDQGGKGQQGSLMEDTRGKAGQQGSLAKDKGSKAGQQGSLAKDQDSKAGQQGISIEDTGEKVGQDTNATKESKFSSTKGKVPLQSKGNSRRPTQTSRKSRSTSLSETSKQVWR